MRCGAKGTYQVLNSIAGIINASINLNVDVPAFYAPRAELGIVFKLFRDHHGISHLER